jgi:hypothetical protein
MQRLGRFWFTGNKCIGLNIFSDSELKSSILKQPIPVNIFNNIMEVFHEGKTSAEYNQISLPPLTILRKNINLTPRRRIITLKLPKVELNPRDTFFVGFNKHTISERPENNRALSMSVECTKIPSPDQSRESPLKSSINQYQMALDDSNRFQTKNKKPSIWAIKAAEKVRLQKFSYLSRKIWKDQTKKRNLSIFLQKLKEKL